MALKIERFQPEGMNVRMSNGQPSYSHVVTVSGTGKLVYTAGQLARDIDGNCVGKGDMRAQMEQTFQNLDRCLKAAGATWADVVKTNTFVTDFDEFQKCGDVRMRYFGVATPTSTTVGVTRLAGPDFMIEIEAGAVVDAVVGVRPRPALVAPRRILIQIAGIARQRIGLGARVESCHDGGARY